MRGLAQIQCAGDLQTAGVAPLIAQNLRADDRCGDGIFAQMTADAPAHRFVIALRTALQPRVDFDQFGGQPFALPPEHRAFLFGPRPAATKHVTLAWFAVGMDNQPHFQPGLHFLPVGLFQQRRFVRPQPTLRGADQVTGFALPQKTQVGRADHAPIHHPDAFGRAIFFLHGTHRCARRS